jgi:DNA-binding NtrC family response regulator
LLRKIPYSEYKNVTSKKILIVDDETNARNALAELLREDGYSVETAADGFKALPKLEEFQPDVILSDLRMPGLDGIGLTKKALELDPDSEVIITTAYGAIETAIDAMRQGATDYLVKPINMQELSLLLERAIEHRRLKREARLLQQRVREKSGIPGIIGSSPAMQEVLQAMLQVAPSKASILILGESGTGKELVAEALHENSTRSKGPFVKLHCAALAENLLESELFGHEKGSFTGALGRRDGRFQQADGGTLFLDEIGEISQSLQVKLLRFLQEHEFERVGGNQTIKVNVRVVTATNRNLLQRVKEGHFREDLYYRLNVISLELPPLRARTGDIALLAAHFVRRYSEENEKHIKGINSEALDRMMRYRWPGNVRELENAIERAVVVCRGDELLLGDLPPALRSESLKEQQNDTPQIPGATLAEIEKYVILKTLELVGGSTSKAADILGISSRKIQYKLHEYQGTLPPPKESE